MTIERNAKTKGLSINDRNTDIPFTPSNSWILTEADKDKLDLELTFGWIQAFFDNTLTENPVLAVYSGKSNDSDGSPQANIIQFAYSGERVKFKGNGILSSGKDCRGVTITSLPIDPESPTTSFLRVIVQGGMY